MKNENVCCESRESLAMASFPIQDWCEPYELSTALSNGTIFPCLNMEIFFAQSNPGKVFNGANIPSPTPKQSSLFDRLNVVSFALNDLTLYMDTHPKCEKGLSLMKKLLQTRLELLADYARSVTPITQLSMITGTPDTDQYGWGEGPAPWEGGFC